MRLSCEIGGQTFGAAEAAAAHRHALRDRVFGAAGKRQRDVESPRAASLPGELPGFGGAAEDEDSFSWLFALLA